MRLAHEGLWLASEDAFGALLELYEVTGTPPSGSPLGFAGFPESLVLAVAAAARESAEAAVKALSAARQLEPRVQFTVFENLRLWRGHADATRLETQRTVDALLGDAYATAPETIRFNGYARQIVADLATGGSAGLRRDAAGLAERIGVLT